MMVRYLIANLPEGFSIAWDDPDKGICTVIYDVTPETFGTWTGCERRGDYLHLLPERSYRHKDLMKRLGLPVEED